MVDSQDLGFTKDGALGIVEQLLGGAKERLSHDRIRLMVSVIMSACHRHGLYQMYSMAEDLSLHRVRPLENRGDWFKSLEDLGHPPSGKATAYGRCHQPRRPVGYWSLYKDTALAEIRAELKEQYVVSTFKLPGGCQLVPIGELDYYRRVGQTYLGHAIERSGKVYQEILARQDWGIFALFDAFVADEFIKPAMTQTDYKVTSAVADVLFNSGMLPARIDGIVYPSVAFRHGTNFAVRAEAFKSKMRAVPAETQIIEITDVFGYGIFDWQVLATLKSINPDGSLNWEPSS